VPGLGADGAGRALLLLTRLARAWRRGFAAGGGDASGRSAAGASAASPVGDAAGAGSSRPRSTDPVLSGSAAAGAAMSLRDGCL
jgi:hypothetical protein